MKQENLFKVRDRRNKGWFFMDNEYLNGYAKIFGAIGTAVYVSLCRHADNETQRCFPSMKLIAEELSIARTTVMKYIKLFEEHHLLEIVKGKRNLKQQWVNNEYVLLDKSEWIKVDSQVQQTDTVSQVQPLSNPSPSDNETQVQSLDTKDTHINNTHITKLSSESLELTTLLNEEVTKNFSFIKPLTTSKLNKDAIEMDRLIRIDGNDPKLVRAVIMWATQDSFWKQNIRSASKLRKQFETLLVKIKSTRREIIKI